MRSSYCLSAQGLSAQGLSAQGLSAQAFIGTGKKYFQSQSDLFIKGKV
jgi:hypothetical protein